MADFSESSKSFIKGLSDFWISFFKEVDQLEVLYKGAEINAGQAYLDLLALLLNNSVQDSVVFNKEYFKYISIDEDELSFIRGVTSADDVYRYQLEDNVVDVPYLNNKVLAPTAGLERDIQYVTNRNTSSLDFVFDPTNAYYEKTFGVLNSQFTVTAQVEGEEGALISVTLTDDGTAPVTVTRNAYAVTIQYDGPANTGTGTAALISQAINLSDVVSPLIRAAVTGINDGSAAPAGVAATNLVKVSSNPLQGFSSRRIEKAFGGKFTSNGVTDWVAEGVEKGDTLRIISGAGTGAPTEYRIALVRTDGLYLDSALPLSESDTSVDYVILRNLEDPTSINEPFAQSGVVTQGAVDGTLDAATRTLTAPTLALSPVHTGDVINVLGVSNNGVGTILDTPDPQTASLGGLLITDETPVLWQLITVVDPTNIGTDGTLVNNTDGTGTFTSATAVFTSAAAGTVLRIYRNGALESYTISQFVSATELTVIMEATAANGAGLDWGWARYRTPVNNLVYGSPAGWPVDDTVAVKARRAADNAPVVRGLDYSVNTDTGVVTPITVWNTSVDNTVTYQYRTTVKQNSVGLQSGADGTVLPLSFSSPTASFDDSHVGYAIRIAGSGGNNNGTHVIESVTSTTSVVLTSDKLVSSVADPNNGTLSWELLERGVADTTVATAGVNQIGMWGPDALVDQFNLYNTFGYLINKFDSSSEEYRAFIRGVFQLFMLGPTLERFESAVNTVAGLSVVRDDGEILLSYDNGAQQSGVDGVFDATTRTFSAASAAFTATDSGSFIYAVDGPNKGTLVQILTVVSPTQVTLSADVTSDTAAEWELTNTGTHAVTTNRTTYAYARNVPLRAAVTDPSNYGTLTFRSFEVLTEVFAVTDYIDEPFWWEFTLIPQELQPNAESARRQSTPRLFENVVGPADDGRVGDPGFIVGADSEGFVPTTTILRSDAGAADGMLTPDPGYPGTSFNTFFESPTGAFTNNDIGNQVVVAGTGYRITQVLSGTRVRIETFLPITASSGLSWEVQTLPLAKRNKAAFVIIDRFLKYHLFSVSFDTSLLGILRTDFFSDLQDLLVTAKPSHTYLVLSPSALFDEVIQVSEEVTISKVLALGGGGAGRVVLSNSNALAVVGSSWKIGSWYRYLSNTSSFIAPQVTVANPLGLPAAGFDHFLTKIEINKTDFTDNGAPVQDADLVLRSSGISGTSAEITGVGNEVTVTVDSTITDTVLLSYLAITEVGSPNQGISRIGAQQPPDTLSVYSTTALAPEMNLDWEIQTTGGIAGRISVDAQGQSFFTDTAQLHAFTTADVGTFIRYPFTATETNTYEIREVTPDPYVVRVAKRNQVTPAAPATVNVSLSGTDRTVTANTAGTLLLSESMGADTTGIRSILYKVVVSSGANAGEERVISRVTGSDTFLYEGTQLSADTAADVAIVVERHYSDEISASDWEHVQQQIVLNNGTLDISAVLNQDPGNVNYTAEGVREPQDPATATFDASQGDTLYAIGMQDPKANKGRSRTSRDVDLRDEPIQITRT